MVQCQKKLLDSLILPHYVQCGSDSDLKESLQDLIQDVLPNANI